MAHLSQSREIQLLTCIHQQWPMDMGMRGGVSRRERVWHIQGSTTLTGIHVEHRGRYVMFQRGDKAKSMNLIEFDSPNPYQRQ